MASFSFVQRGDRIEVPTLEFYNAIVAQLRKDSKFRKGFLSNTEEMIPQYKNLPKQIQIRAEEGIEKYSIFTVDYISGTGSFITTGTGTGGDIEEELNFDPRIPKAYSRQIDGTEAGPVFVVNEAQRMILGADYVLDILGDEKPRIVNYDPADGIPDVGEEVGPKPGTYKVAQGYTGCIVVSGPDLENERIWVVRVGGGGTDAQYVRFYIDSVDLVNYSALVTITARPCGVTAVTGESNGQLTVYDPCQCWLTGTSADLVSRCGGARYMQPVTLQEDTGTGTGTDSIGCPDTCCWEIDWLCCPAC